MTGIERTDRKSSRYWRGPKMWGVPSRLVGEPLLPGARVTAPHLDPLGARHPHRRSAGLLSHLDGGRRPARTDALVGQCRRPDSLLAVEHRPPDVVPQPLVVDYALRDRLREPVALPPALESPCALALSFRRGGTCGLDRIGGRTELVRRDVCDDRRLAGGVRGMA